jgi:glyceraldehyde-3-phosphate dehydrogenase (ferredoxin)
MVDVREGLYRIDRYRVGDFFGPIDLGYYLSTHHDCLSFGIGLLAGSIFPGSNRLFFTGMSPCWHGFYVSSMGGAGLVFDNLGINMVSLVGRAPTPSILYLNRLHGEEIQVEVEPLDLPVIWQRHPGGVYALMEEALARFGERFATDPRVLAVGPAAAATDFGAIASAPISRGRVTPIDTWAGRGGFGTRLLNQHGLAAIIFGGTFVDEDFRDRKVADQWFENRYQKKLMAKDLEATVKYRFDPAFETGGTFGVNYAKLGGRILAFNYRSIEWQEEERLDLHERFIKQHYLDQFNQETIKTKSMKHCGEPCPAVCKKLRDVYKKDFEPYQTMGPLCGVFDQRAAERLTHHADRLGFDAISVGGVMSWLLECLDDGLIEPAELGVKDRPVFTTSGFNLVNDSMHNAELGVSLLDAMVSGNGIIDLRRGARRFARELARQRGPEVRDRFLYTAFARRGWMVPNQYWTPGVLSPMAMMGKYYMYYGSNCLPPRELGRLDARRMIAELTLDNLGFCRFHRKWAEEMLPEIVGSLFGLKDEYQQQIAELAVRINSHNAAVCWEPSRAIDYVHSFLRRRYEVEGDRSSDLAGWLKRFDQDRREAALEYWFEILKGIHETLRG